MPHIDTLSLFTPWSASGQSRFARPVAAITSFMRRLASGLGHPLPPARPRIRQDLDVRQAEVHFSSATDLADLERMERDWDRRDAGGMRTWDWR